VNAVASGRASDAVTAVVREGFSAVTAGTRSGEERVTPASGQSPFVLLTRAGRPPASVEAQGAWAAVRSSCTKRSPSSVRVVPSHETDGYLRPPQQVRELTVRRKEGPLLTSLATGDASSRLAGAYRLHPNAIQRPGLLRPGYSLSEEGLAPVTYPILPQHRTS
jgi:hypothetical protein